MKGRSLGEAQSALRSNELGVSKDSLFPPQLFTYLLVCTTADGYRRVLGSVLQGRCRPSKTAKPGQARSGVM